MVSASGKTLIIAEKPSVATDLARVLGKIPELGKFEKKKDYFQNDRAYISSAVGHLVELKMPLTAEGKKLPWTMKHLPAIPTKFELQPIERSETRYKLLLRLLNKKDVDTVVNACDAGREGELIFRYLMQLANLKKPITVKRMWFQSMTDDAIIDAWRNLRSDHEMAPLADAAKCRSESDWLIGLNGTRALTAYNSRHGGFNVTSAGRVQTPTLAILAEREKEIRSFVSRPYFEVHGEFAVPTGSYPGRWFREDFQKVEDDKHQKAERLWTREEAAAVVERCQGQVAIVEETKKPSKSSAPQLFDLTSLQREASSKHGFSAQRTLQLAQALYDRYKLLTYPRTDSKCLPEDYVAVVQDTIKTFSKSKPSEALPDSLIHCSKWIVDNDRVGPSKRIFDNKKVSDHFAIIPTGKVTNAKLDDAARKLFQLVLRRFLAIFYPSAEFENTRRITRIGSDAFLTTGKVLVVPGYLEVYGRKAGVATEKDELVAAENGCDAQTDSLQLKECATNPPARYTDSSLLSAMETAGRRVDDEALREAMSDRGLGTPATRANIIENLITKKYVFRDENRRSDLVVSNKGLALIDLLEEIGITTIGSAEMTGEWEYKLKQIEEGTMKREEFMDQIVDLTQQVVEQTRAHKAKLESRKFPDLDVACPECGASPLKQTDGVFECYKITKTGEEKPCTFRLKKYIASHELTEEQAKRLIEDKLVGPIDTFKTRFGQPFTAELTLEKPKRVWKVGFKFEGDDEREQEVDNLTDEQIICECPILDDADTLVKVYENERAFLAPDMAKAKNERGVRISKTILQKEIPTEQAIKLFVEGKTELMPGFVSKKGRKFSAHLTLDRESGKLGFEFAPRKKKTTDKKSDKAESAAATGDNADDPAAAKTVKKKPPAKKKTTKKRRTTKKKSS